MSTNIFANMLNDEINNEDTFYILDTNFLLNSLKSPNYSKNYINALEKNYENLFLPFIVWVEFLYNFQRVIFQTEGFLKQTKAMLTEIDDIQSIILADKDIENKIDSIFKKKILKGENSLGKELLEAEKNKILNSLKQDKKFVNSLDYINKNLDKNIQEWKESQKENFEVFDNYILQVKDHLQLISQMIESKQIIVGEEYSDEKLSEYIEKIKTRVEKEQFPGISKEDLSKKDRIWNGKIIPGKYGDIFLWLETLDYAKNSQKSNFIIVSDDEKKGDWIDKTTNGSFYPQMIIEFINYTGKDTIGHMSNSDFVSKFDREKVSREDITRDLLDSENDKEILNEIDDFAKFIENIEDIKKYNLNPEIINSLNSKYNSSQLEIEDKVTVLLRRILAKDYEVYKNFKPNFDYVMDIIAVSKNTAQKDIIFEIEILKQIDKLKLNNKVEILNNYAEKYFRDTGKVAIKCIIVVSKDIDEEYKSDLKKLINDENIKILFLNNSIFEVF
ncbi:PIN-like domain-containing protein [Streptococcus pluranimalium]